MGDTSFAMALLSVSSIRVVFAIIVSIRLENVVLVLAIIPRRLRQCLRPRLRRRPLPRQCHRHRPRRHRRRRRCHRLRRCCKCEFQNGSLFKGLISSRTKKA